MGPSQAGNTQKTTTRTTQKRHKSLTSIASRIILIRMPQWTVDERDAGERLDKFLASPDRAGSRAKAADALDRGKVFVNDREAALTDAATRIAAGDVVRLWIDRPGRAKRRS